MKKLITAILICTILLSPIPSQASSATGTQANPRIISNNADFVAMITYARNNPDARIFYRIAEGVEITQDTPNDIIFRTISFTNLATSENVETYNIAFVGDFTRANYFTISIPRGYRSHGRAGNILVQALGFGGSGPPEFWAGEAGGNIGVVPVGTAFRGDGTSTNPFVISNASEYRMMCNEMYARINDIYSPSWGSNVYFISHNNLRSELTSTGLTNHSDIFVQSHVNLQVGNQILMFGSPYSTGSGPRRPFSIYRLKLPFGYTYNGFDTILAKYDDGFSNMSEERLRELSEFMFGLPQATLFPIVPYGSTIRIDQPPPPPSSGGSGGGGGSQPTPAPSPTPTPHPLAHFHDVTPHNWFYEDVQFTIANNLFTGTSPNSFEPFLPMTRAMTITVLARHAGIETTAPNRYWWELATEWGIANGITDGEYLANNITREQLVTLLWRYANQPTAETTSHDFTDSHAISDWALEAMNWAIQAEIISGRDDGTLDPQSTATRAEVAAIMHRFATR